MAWRYEFDENYHGWTKGPDYTREEGLEYAINYCDGDQVKAQYFIEPILVYINSEDLSSASMNPDDDLVPDYYDPDEVKDWAKREILFQETENKWLEEKDLLENYDYWYALNSH